MRREEPSRTVRGVSGAGCLPRHLLQDGVGGVEAPLAALAVGLEEFLVPENRVGREKPFRGMVVVTAHGYRYKDYL